MADMDDNEEYEENAATTDAPFNNDPNAKETFAFADNPWLKQSKLKKKGAGVKKRPSKTLKQPLNNDDSNNSNNNNNNNNEEIENLKQEILSKTEEITLKDSKINELNDLINQTNEELNQKNSIIKELHEKVSNLEDENDNLQNEIKEKDEKIEEQQNQIEQNNNNNNNNNNNKEKEDDNNDNNNNDDNDKDSNDEENNDDDNNDKKDNKNTNNDNNDNDNNEEVKQLKELVSDKDNTINKLNATINMLKKKNSSLSEEMKKLMLNQKKQLNIASNIGSFDDDFDTKQADIDNNNNNEEDNATTDESPQKTPTTNNNSSNKPKTPNSSKLSLKKRQSKTASPKNNATDNNDNIMTTNKDASIKGKMAKYIIKLHHPCIEIDLGIYDKETNQQTLRGTLIVVLFSKERPKTVDNFLALMGFGKNNKNKNIKRRDNNSKKLGAYYNYASMNSLFHEINYEKGLIIGGDVLNEDGSGEALSIYGKYFKNENTKKDCIALQKYSFVMVQNYSSDPNNPQNDGPDFNGCQFMILMKPQMHWNLKYVCFGYIVDDKCREFLDDLYLNHAFKNIENSKTNTPDFDYKIKALKGNKPVRYPVKNHLAKLQNAIV